MSRRRRARVNGHGAYEPKTFCCSRNSERKRRHAPHSKGFACFKVLPSSRQRLKCGASRRFRLAVALRPLLLFGFALTIATIPFKVRAHGELLIRIGELTRR